MRVRGNRGRLLLDSSIENLGSCACGCGLLFMVFRLRIFILQLQDIESLSSQS